MMFFIDESSFSLRAYKLFKAVMIIFKSFRKILTDRWKDANSFHGLEMYHKKTILLLSPQCIDRTLPLIINRIKISKNFHCLQTTALVLSACNY